MKPGVGLVLLASFATSLAGQQPRPAYEAGALDQSSYIQRVHAVITTRTGRSSARDTLDRVGVLSLRARPVVGGLELLVWFDSLTLRRATAAGVLRPDTDGLIGGRYGGRLTPDGRYTAQRTPFLPEGILEVEDLAGEAGDLLPRLPPIPLLPGESWSDSLGMITISRLEDSTAQGRRLRRYRLERQSLRTESRVAPDSNRYAVSRTETETGRFVWDARQGVLRWTREITSEAEIPAGRPFPRAVRSEIQQRIQLEREQKPED